MSTAQKEREASSDRNGDPESHGSVPVPVPAGEGVAAAAGPTATSAAETTLPTEAMYLELLRSLDPLLPLLGLQQSSSDRNPPPRPTMQWPPNLEHPDKPALEEGLEVARFKDDADWAASFKSTVGSLTTSITLSANLKITTDHLDFLALYPEVCCNPVSFVYASEASQNSWEREGMTDECLARFARACPKLRSFSLPGTAGISDAALIAFCESCPDLQHLEIYGGMDEWNNHRGPVIKALAEHPEWAPNLVLLTMTYDPERKTRTKSMLALTRARTMLTIRLLYPGWEMDEGWPYEVPEYDEHMYRNGERVWDYPALPGQVLNDWS